MARQQEVGIPLFILGVCIVIIVAGTVLIVNNTTSSDELIGIPMCDYEHNIGMYVYDNDYVVRMTEAEYAEDC